VRAVRCVLLGALALLAPLAAAAAGEDSLRLVVEAAGEDLFMEPATGGERLDPGPGRAACLLRYDRFELESTDQVTVIAPDGEAVPLVIETCSIFEEFNEIIVGLRLYFVVPEGRARPGEDVYELKWGPEVSATNSRVERLFLDPDLCDRYRALRAAPAGGEDSTTASIVIIADSSADYHFLWYLLPMAMIFALLTVRKVLAGAGGLEADGDSTARPRA
jgi:hypothetical protein